MKRLIATGLRIIFRIEDHLSWCLNQLATRYGEGVHVKHRLMLYHDFFVERIRPEDHVLDIGCGIGAVAYSVASRSGAKVTGIDLSAKNIALARDRFEHPGLTFMHADVLHGLPPGEYDVILLSNILEHIEHRNEFLTTIRQRLHPKRWLIRVPLSTRDWRVPLRKELGLFHFSDPTHYTEYTQESFEDEMRQAGLQVVELRINWGEIWAEAKNA